MKLRFEIDLTITLITAVIFQIYLVSYGTAFTAVTSYAVNNNIIGNTPKVFDFSDPVYVKFLSLLDECGA
jgi:hypothetical protein